MQFLRKHKLVIGIFVVALLIRVVFFFVSLNHFGDLETTIHGHDGYFAISKNLVEGNGFSADGGPEYRPHPLRPPVYPFYLAAILWLTGGSYVIVTIVNLLIGSSLPVLAYFLARRIVSDKLARIVAYVLIFEPFTVLLSFIFYTETLFVFFFFLFLLFFFRYFEEKTYRNIIWSAVFFGLAVLVKPTIQYLPFVIPVFILWYYRTSFTKHLAYQMAVFGGVVLLLMAPWFYRNYAEYRVVGISAQPSFNLYVYFAPSVKVIEKGTTFGQEQEILLASGEFDGLNINLANQDFFKNRAIEEIKKYPAGVPKLLAISGATFFTHDGMLTVLKHEGFGIKAPVQRSVFLLLVESPGKVFGWFKELLMSQAVFIFIARIAWAFVTLGFFAGVFLYWKREKLSPAAITAIFLVLYFAATTTINGLGVNARFRVPVNVFILTFAVYSFSFLVNWIRNRYSGANQNEK